MGEAVKWANMTDIDGKCRHCGRSDDKRRLDEIDPAAPVPELEGTFPVVLYFGSDEDREGFIAIAQEAIPGMTAKKL